MKPSLTSTIVLFIGIAAVAACSSSRHSEREVQWQNVNTNTTAVNITAANDVAAAPKTAPTVKQSSGLPSFKVGEDYKTGVRDKMLKAGWEPFHSEEAQPCGSGDTTCDEFPEMESCAGTGLGNCKFLWKRGEKLAAIFTVDAPPVFSSSEVEALPKQTADDGAAGKYELAETGLSGDHALELKKDYTADFKLLEEDGTSTGSGSWSRDEAKKLLTVNLTVETRIAGDEPDEKPTVSKVYFQFQKAGKNLKIIGENFSRDRIYIGKTFRAVN